MGVKYHIGKNGPAPCRATKRACRFGGDNTHYTSLEDAQHAYEKDLHDKVIPETLIEESQEKTRPNFSFLEEIRESFEKDALVFDAFPDKFYKRSVYDVKAGRLPSFVTTPQEGNITTEEAKRIARECGITEIMPYPERFQYLYGEGFVGRDEYGHTIIFTQHKYKNRTINDTWRYKRGTSYTELADGFRYGTYRDIVGIARLRTVYACDTSEYMGDGWSYPGKEKFLQKLYDFQRKGEKFLSTRKYFRQTEGEIATVLDDKKNPDKKHLDMVEHSSLREKFTHIEIDNDVDKERWEEFETDVHAALEKLPPIPDDKKPILRVRYLGKHRATGLYSLGANTLAVDVRDSSSFIHEYGHYVDQALLNNASLKDSFDDIIIDYKRHLNPPAHMRNKREYYATPTEIFARGFEMYAHEKLGISGRLVNPEHFQEFDYTAFTDSTKEKMFALFDTLVQK